IFSHKELTTPQAPADGAIQGIRTLCERESIDGAQITRVVHATTLFTNALTERRGAKTGLITTHGSRDTLDMRREFKYDLYDLFLDMPNALVPRYLRGEVRERMSFDGSIDTPLDTAELEKVAQHLVNESVESLAIVFLHSYANPTHERQARDILQQRFPDLNI